MPVATIPVWDTLAETLSQSLALFVIDSHCIPTALSIKNCCPIAFLSGGIDSSISARGPVSTQHAQFVALAQAQRGAVTARAHIGSISASTATVESEQKRQQQQQQRNESSASTTRQQPPAAAGQRPESVAVKEDAESDNDSAWESGSLRPSLALRRYSEYLTPFEQSEILDFPEVCCVCASSTAADSCLFCFTLLSSNTNANSSS